MRGGLLAAAATGALLIGSVAEADTLREALVAHLWHQPDLTGQRAQLRGLDEDVAIAPLAGPPAAVRAPAGSTRTC